MQDAQQQAPHGFSMAHFFTTVMTRAGGHQIATTILRVNPVAPMTRMELGTI